MKQINYLLRRLGTKSGLINTIRAVSQQAALTTKVAFQPVIGLEIHAQIASKAKLFSGASTAYGGQTNNQVAFLDAALPGTLPVLNRYCVEAGVITSLALNCQLNKVSYFDRKHYFYADLPAGYQITQQRLPLAQHGSLQYVVDGLTKQTGIWQVQLEQDSGKSLHDDQQGISLIDLNRAGVGLMEIVTAPDFQSGNDAAAFIKELQLILKTLGTCNGKMEEGSLRVDASVSLHKPGEPLGVRAEVKNLNSIRFVRKAIDYEITRQEKILQSGEDVTNETRSFDPEAGVTITMRDKEKVHDYRFMPEPNLPPLRLYDSTDQEQHGSLNIENIKQSMPLLPQERRQYLTDTFGLSMEHACHVVLEDGLWEAFIAVCTNTTRPPKVVYSLMLNELQEELNKMGTTLPNSSMTTEQFGTIVDMMIDRTVTRMTASKLIAECLQNADIDLKDLVETLGWTQITDPDQIAPLCDQIMADNVKIVKKYRKGKTKYLHPLVSYVVTASNGLADPVIVKEILTHKLLNTDNNNKS